MYFETVTTYLTHVVLAVVDVYRTVVAFKTKKTFASVMRIVIDAPGVVLARVEFFAAKGNFRFAVLAHKTRLAFAAVSLDLIDAGRVILAFVVSAIVDVRFAPHAGETGCAIATKSSLLQNLAGRSVPTGISVTGVDHELTVLSVVARSAAAFVLSAGEWSAFRSVLTRERVAGVAFGENFVTYATCKNVRPISKYHLDINRFNTFALESRCGGGEYEFVSHGGRFGAPCDSRFNVIEFNPLG